MQNSFLQLYDFKPDTSFTRTVLSLTHEGQGLTGVRLVSSRGMWRCG